jgi:hypothetical protein
MRRTTESRSDYDLAREASRRLFSPSWVRRYANSDNQEAARCLAEKYGLGGCPNSLRDLCDLFAKFPKRSDFEAALVVHKHRGIESLLAHLFECEVDVSAAWREQTSPEEVHRFLHECFRRAWEYAMFHEAIGAMLVHGRLFASRVDGGCGHAWVELPGGVIFDGVTQRFYDGERYRRSRDARVTRTYSPRAALPLGLRNRNYGPWADP